MISKISFNNFKAFMDQVELSLNAANAIQRFDCNVVDVKDRKILKTIGVYGPNNTGKTWSLLSLAALKHLMLGKLTEDISNSFVQNKETSFDVEYEIEGRFYKYEAKYDSDNRFINFEKLSKISLASSNKYVKTYSVLFERNGDSLLINGVATNKDKNQFGFMKNAPIMTMLHFNAGTDLEMVQKDYFSFANSISIVQMEKPLNIALTIELLQKDQNAAEFITEFIKNCDLNIEEFGINNEIDSDVDITKQINRYVNQLQNLKIFTKHKGFRVPSILFDSIGTQKLIALSGYIYDALKNGKILVIDEIDSSLHHLITRALVSMFNNPLNEKAQLIFSTHDILLLDLKHLLRKDQIFLTDFDTSGHIIIKRLSDFSSKEDNGLRGDEDITKFYLSGRFGSIPTPDLFNALEKIYDNR